MKQANNGWNMKQVIDETRQWWNMKQSKVLLALKVWKKSTMQQAWRTYGKAETQTQPTQPTQPEYIERKSRVHTVKNVKKVKERQRVKSQRQKWLSIMQNTKYYRQIQKPRYA